MLRVLALTGSLALLPAFLAGCHHVASDYPDFLVQHPARPALPHVPVNARYSIAEQTLQHSVTVRSVAAGYGNKWIMEVGQMLDQSMQSADVRRAFESLTKQAGAAPAGALLIELELQDYYVADFAAHMVLRMRLLRDGTVLLDKIYKGEGGSNEYNLAWGNARKALQAATKRATEIILRDFLMDMPSTLEPSSGAAAADVGKAAIPGA